MYKYDDRHESKNPLREAKGPSITKAGTIMRMIKAGRFPTRELLMNIPYQYEFFIDSITEAGYNSEGINEYARETDDLHYAQYCPKCETVQSIDNEFCENKKCKTQGGKTFIEGTMTESI